MGAIIVNRENGYKAVEMSTVRGCDLAGFGGKAVFEFVGIHDAYFGAVTYHVRPYSEIYRIESLNINH